LSGNVTPSIYGVDSYGSQFPKLQMAIAIRDQIINNPGKYILVGHSAGGSAVILAVRMLQNSGYGDRVSAVILLDPAMDSEYPLDESGALGSIQEAANQIAANGTPVFLGDSLLDGNDSITGAYEYQTNRDVSHTQLAISSNVYLHITTSKSWSNVK
jgi:pimeloyl-ACP methyl ester carboxylesterase